MDSVVKLHYHIFLGIIDLDLNEWFSLSMAGQLFRKDLLIIICVRVSLLVDIFFLLVLVSFVIN